MLQDFIREREQLKTELRSPYLSAKNLIQRVVSRDPNVRRHTLRIRRRELVPEKLLTENAKKYAQQRRHDSKSCRENFGCFVLLFLGITIFTYSLLYGVIPYSSERRFWPMEDLQYKDEDEAGGSGSGSGSGHRFSNQTDGKKGRHIIWAVTVYAIAAICFLYNLLRRNSRERFIVSSLLFIVSLILASVFPWTLPEDEWGFYFSACAGAVNCGILGAVLYRWFNTLFHGNMPVYTLPLMYRDPYKLTKVKSALKTGDLVFCSEARKCTSQVIRFFTYSPYSHVAMIIRDPTPEIRRAYNLRPVLGGDDAWDGTGHDVYVFEASPPCCQMVEIEEWMIIESMEYPDSFTAVRQLDLGYADEQRCTCGRPRAGLTHEELTAKLSAYVVECAARRYETNPIELAKSAFQLNNDAGPDEVFCSELIAYCYKKAGLLRGNRLANNYAPITFSGISKYVDPLTLAPGVRLSPNEWRLVVKDAPRRACCQTWHNVLCFLCEKRDRRLIRKVVSRYGHIPDFVPEVRPTPCSPADRRRVGVGCNRDVDKEIEFEESFVGRGDSRVRHESTCNEGAAATKTLDGGVDVIVTVKEDADVGRK